MEYKRDERRRFVRFDLNANVKFRFFDNIDEGIKGKAKDLSAEGVCIVTETELPIDKDIEIDISFPGRKRPVRVRGKTAWVYEIKRPDKKKTGHFEAGIKLYTVDKGDENTLLKYYCERMVGTLSQYMHL
ncbi:MAG: PilZ domain-containing protein [Candidatus Omnitrophica bacterium]|nr:PilZ domain-containing protein [Candidatus Omnitrophota bacterium]